MNGLNRMYTRMVPIVALLVCVLAASAEDVGLGTLLKSFPGYHLLALQERDADLRNFFAQHFPKNDPSVVRGDFNGDGNPDYALLLKNDRTGATKLVVLLCSVDAQCKSVYELDETAYAGSIYLRPVVSRSGVSRSNALDPGPQPVKLPLTGIQVNYFEKGKVVLHWNAKLQKIEEVQTGD